MKLSDFEPAGLIRRAVSNRRMPKKTRRLPVSRPVIKHHPRLFPTSGGIAAQWPWQVASSRFKTGTGTLAVAEFAGEHSVLPGASPGFETRCRGFRQKSPNSSSSALQMRLGLSIPATSGETQATTLNCSSDPVSHPSVKTSNELQRGTSGEVHYDKLIGIQLSAPISGCIFWRFRGQ